MNIDDITVLNDIRERLARVTEEELKIVEVHLDQPKAGEKVVGIISGPTRALWVLSRQFHAEHLLQAAMATQLIEKELVQEHLRNAMIGSEFEDLVAELMWTQARTDTGYWESASVGIRSEWQLVAFERPPQNTLVDILKLGPFPLRPPEE